MMKQGVMFAMALSATTIGCGGKGTTPPVGMGNQGGAASWAPTMIVAAADVPGVIAYAPFASRDDGGMMPASKDGTIVWPVTEGRTLAVGASFLLLGGAGAPVSATLGAATTVEHGCDGGDLNVLPLTPAAGATLPGGVVWAVPADLPAGWAPQVVTLEPGEASTARASWTAGPLTITSTTSSKTVGELTVAAGDRVIGRVPYERGTMDDDPDAAIDLSGDGHNPGVPRPVAAWLVAPEGPMVLATYIQGFEGSGATTYLVGESTMEPIEQLADGVYYCAY